MVASRREARERVLELLYELEMKKLEPADLLGDLAISPGEWIARYVTAVAENAPLLDLQISKHLRSDWELSRLAVVDRLVLRMGLWELGHGDAPSAVVLAEAVELAQRYGGEHSARFVNGVLAAANASDD